MILVVALNPALDVTHHVARVDWSGVNRPGQVRAIPGGKGLNVARTLRALGSEALVIGLAGGVTGDAVRAGLTAAGVPARFASIAGETRRTFAVVDAHRQDTALFNEPGPEVSGPEWAEFLVLYENALPGRTAVVLSGSLPPGRVAGYPTGAGDAVVAGLAHGIAFGTPWPERLRHAAALGTAAAAAPAAGQFDPEDYARALAGVSVARWADG